MKVRKKIISIIMFFCIVINLFLPIVKVYALSGNIDAVMNSVSVTCPKMKNTAINAIQNEIINSKGVDSTVANKIFQKYSSDSSKITVDYTVFTPTLAGGDGQFSLNGITIDLTSEEINSVANEDIKNKYNMDSNINSSAAMGQDPSGVMAETGSLDWDQLGGTLLRPFVAFVNFIADTVMKWTGKFMYPEVYKESDSDEAIMTDKAPDLGYTNAQDFPGEIDTSDFKSLTGNYYPNFRYTPEEIFSGKIDLLNIDFISGTDSSGNPIQSEGWNAIRQVVASWYKVLRMMAIIALLSVLIYTGVRIIISSNVKDKAKYKEWILNWFVAVGILFVMHYIMSFTITVINSFSNLMQSNFSGIHVRTSNHGEFTTNLMGFVRFRMLENKATVKVGYLVMYIALVWYTLKFTFVYLKRVINMAFLTLLAPIVAATYPIDKLADGQAQGFQMWIKEYIFNALLQPMHLLLYYILVGSAIQLAATNVLYGIVALKFISDAEKIFKKIFGFDKAREGMVGGLQTAFAATSVAKNLKDLTKIGKLGGQGKSGGAGPSSNEIPTFNPLKDNDDGIVGGLNSSGGGGSSAGGSSAGGSSGGGSSAGGSSGGTSGAGGSGGRASGAGSSSRGSSSAGGSNRVSSGAGSSVLRNIGAGLLGGGKALGKSALKFGKDTVRNITGFDPTKKGNFRRVGGKALRSLVGLGVGATAAAVQAGISITDGKYNPLEGIGTFTAGFAGGSKLTGGIQKKFMDGYVANLPEEEQRKRAVEDYIGRDDIRETVHRALPNENLGDLMDRIGEDYVQYGETDINKILKSIKNADKLKNRYNFESGVADQQVRLIEREKQRINEEGIKLKDIFYPGAGRDSYLDHRSGGDAEVRKKYEAMLTMMRELQ